MEYSARKQDMRYVVVTPVRDEQDFLPLAIESMARQTVLPQEWIIVNDGSTDNTRAIIDRAAAQYPWIRGLHRADRGYRKWGAGIIEAFYAGFNTLTCTDWEVMCKLDGDLSFGPTYFEDLIQRLRSRPDIGIAGGALYEWTGAEKVWERHPLFHVRGGVKTYTRECWKALGGLWVGPGSDTVDEVKANMLGWKTQTFTDLELIHHRPTSRSFGRWNGMVKDGRVDYVYGAHPAFLLAKVTVRLFRRPYVIHSMALLYGYILAHLQKTPRVDDPALIRYLRRQQIQRLLGRTTIWQ